MGFLRISTSDVFDQQTAIIDTLSVQQSLLAKEAATGKVLNLAGDNPTIIAQDLSVRTTIAQDQQTSSNLQNTISELTTADGALSTVTDALQKVRALAVEGSSDAVTPAQQQDIGTQVDQLLQEIIGLANTQFGGKFVFAGTANPSSAPFVANGSPASGVTFSGNESIVTQEFTNGQRVQTNVTAQQAFNFGSADGSPDVFSMLATLRDTLNKGLIVDKSQASINLAGQAVTGATTVAQLTAANPPAPPPQQVLQTPLTLDSTGNVSITIASKTAPNGVLITFGPGSTVANIVAGINAQTAVTGVSAAFDPKQERLALTSTVGAFQVSDAPSAGAVNTGNFVKAFGLTQQADLVNNLSTQIGDIDHVLGTVTVARASVGSTIQTLAGIQTATSAESLTQTQVQSNLEDADAAKVIAQFSQIQTTLQAALATTARVTSKQLFDFLSGG